MPYPFLNPRELEKVKQIAESQKTTVYQVMKAVVKVGLDYIEEEINRTAPKISNPTQSTTDEAQ